MRYQAALRSDRGDGSFNSPRAYRNALSWVVTPATAPMRLDPSAGRRTRRTGDWRFRAISPTCESMIAFAALLERLVFTPSRNAKIALLRRYFATQPDPDRGIGLAAITGELSFTAAKPGLIRELAAARTDPVLFDWSYDYVGDLAETVALIWPARPVRHRSAEPCGGCGDARNRAQGCACRDWWRSGWTARMPRRGWPC